MVIVAAMKNGLIMVPEVGGQRRESRRRNRPCK